MSVGSASKNYVKKLIALVRIARQKTSWGVGTAKYHCAVFVDGNNNNGALGIQREFLPSLPPWLGATRRPVPHPTAAQLCGPGLRPTNPLLSHKAFREYAEAIFLRNDDTELEWILLRCHSSTLHSPRRLIRPRD